MRIGGGTEQKKSEKKAGPLDFARDGNHGPVVFRQAQRGATVNAVLDTSGNGTGLSSCRKDYRGIRTFPISGPCPKDFSDLGGGSMPPGYHDV